MDEEYGDTVVWVDFVQHAFNIVAKHQPGTYCRYCHVLKPPCTEKRAFDTSLITVIMLQMRIYSDVDCRSSSSSALQLW
jgi:hypothetical protein